MLSSTLWFNLRCRTQELFRKLCVYLLTELIKHLPKMVLYFLQAHSFKEPLLLAFI